MVVAGYAWRVALLLAFGVLVNYFDRVSLSVAMAQIQPEFGLTAVTTGYVGRNASQKKGAASGLYLACYFLGGLFGSALLGQLFDQAEAPRKSASGACFTV